MVKRARLTVRRESALRQADLDTVIRVAAALAPILRGQPGRNFGDNDDTTWRLAAEGPGVEAAALAASASAVAAVAEVTAAGGVSRRQAGGLP
jgi:hypothetical protein